jgi:hypothetical protein
VRLEGIGQLKNSVTSLGIEPATIFYISMPKIKLRHQLCDVDININFLRTC